MMPNPAGRTDKIAIRFVRAYDIVPDPKPLRLDWLAVAAGPKMRLWRAPGGDWVLTIPPRVYVDQAIDVEHLTFQTFERGVEAVTRFAASMRAGLWRYQMPRPRVDAKTSNWPAILALSLGILSAFAFGVGFVWLWGRFVVACR